MVEQKPSKLMTRVRFPSPAPGISKDRGIAAASPCSSVVEHSLGKGEVARSIRAIGTRKATVLGVRKRLRLLHEIRLTNNTLR